MDNISQQDILEPVVLNLAQKKSGLWKALLLSAGFDIAMTFLELPLDFQFLGMPIIIDEIIGFFLSQFLVGTNIDIKMRNRLVGLLPIPGVTAISVQCAIELWKIRKQEKELMN